MDLTDLNNLKFPRFFIDTETEVSESVIITGDDAKHICMVLRMRAGEKVVLCDSNGFDYPAEIISTEKSRAEFKILVKRENDAEPKIKIRLFQCVPKGEKLDYIVQKATELGVSEIIPVISKRCVSRPKNSAKISRLQKIAENAAKQSGRGKIPLVHEFTDFDYALKLHTKDSLGIIFYENGGKKLNDIFKNLTNTASDSLSVNVLIGSEGGFEAAEVEKAKAAGFIPASLGKLILRTETAPVAAIAVLMNLTGEI